ncbi:MAG: hypothetical protein IK057_04800 [Clostridia bacterium]|nr:hypothetical protein [Clostridia bacterium]
MTELNSKLNDFLSKYVNNKSLYIIIIIGIVFMLLPSFGGEKNDNSKPQKYDEYSDEARLSEILSKVSGAGKVSVMITYYGTTGYDLEFEEKRGEVSSENSVVMDGNSPFIKSEFYPKVKGVIIVSSGPVSSTVKKSLSDAAAAVLEVSSHKICVLEGKERN